MVGGRPPTYGERTWWSPVSSGDHEVGRAARFPRKAGTLGLGAGRPVRTSKRVRARARCGYAFWLDDDADRVARLTRRHRGPTGVFALAAVAEPADRFEYRVECGFQRFGVAFDLGEEQAAL
jgi:hypothetical protein